ncbi:uncharacterized protein [Haliotis asinina]|uniref:uncharacterized protein n=1 Tax=Haliotis asinina TaxID=109174 RepID=UPI003531AD69
MDESHYGVSDTVEPVLIHSAHIRHERSATHMPDVLHFRFDLSGTEVSLNLTRSERDIESYPVYVTDERGTVLQTDLPQHENTAVYRSSAQGSAAIIQREEEDVYQLSGTIHVNNQRYNIWPKKHQVNKRQASDTRNQHELREIIPFNMSDDTVNLQSEFPTLQQGTPSNVQDSQANVQDIRSNVQGMSGNPVHYTIEMGVFPDFADYTGFLRNANGNTTVTISNMRLYYAFVEEMMQIRYDTVNKQDPSFSITVWTKFINIATSAAGSPWTETTRNGSVVPAIPALLGLVNYLLVNAPRSADAYMIFTRYDLVNQFPVIGTAAIDQLCTDIPVGITKNFGSGIVGTIAAHELGHILGLRHDSEVGCNDTDWFVMGSFIGFVPPLTPSNPWTFSPCSVATLKTTLSVRECALNTSISGSTLSTNGQRAGQTFHADQQCRDHFSSLSTFCRGVSRYENGTNYELMCRVTFCSAPGNLCFGVIPLDQTSCGDKMWCERGECVHNALAPARSAKCPQGDDPAFTCEAASCTTYSSPRLLACCATCAAQIPQKKTTVRFIVLRTAPPILFFG